METKTENTKARMLLDQLDYKTLREIIEIYDQVVGGSGLRFFSKSDYHFAMGILTGGNSANWKFGSKLSGHSQLQIHVLPYFETRTEDEVIYFQFYVNSHNIPKGTKELSEEFVNALSEYLDSRGLLVVD